MCIRKRTLMVWGIGVVAAVLLAGAWGLGDAPRPATAQVDPAEVVQEHTDALNAGDVDAVMEFYTDDAVLVGALCAPVECVGKDTIRGAIEYYVAVNVRVTAISSEISGNTVTASIEVVTDEIRARGMDRIVNSCITQVRDGKISESRCEADLTDPQTAEYVARVEGKDFTFGLGPGRDADQTPGRVSLGEYRTRTSVWITFVEGGPAGVRQPAHIHEGSCDSLGAVAFSLNDVVGGRSGTPLLQVPISDLQTGEYAVNVHKSKDEPDVYVACADIPAPPPEAPPVEPAPAPEVVVAPVPPATGSGGLLGEEGSGLAAWWYALVVGGALLVMGGLAVLGKARRAR